MGKLFGRKHTAACAENNIAAVIVFNDSRLNIFAGKSGTVSICAMKPIAGQLSQPGVAATEA